MATQDTLGRRQFLKSTALGAGILLSRRFPSLQGAESPNKKIVVGVMGTNGRGMAHIDAYLSLPDTEVAYVCDVDSRAIEKAAAAVVRRNRKRPQGVSDFRQILEDPAVDVISVATPNHWHAPAAILACAAGKHVYVEKPGSHNPREGELIVQAARKNNRVVQMGNQRRSWPHIIEAVQRGVQRRCFTATCGSGDQQHPVGQFQRVLQGLHRLLFKAHGIQI